MLVILKFDNEEREVLHCRFSNDQTINGQNRPSADMRVGLIEVQVAYEKANEAIWQWSIDPHKQFSGTIEFIDPVKGGQLRVVEFTDAHCVGYESSFTEMNAEQATETLMLSPTGITINGATLSIDKKKSS